MSDILDKDKERGINIVTINIRGLQGSETPIERLVGEAERVVITESWKNRRDLLLIEGVSEQSSRTLINRRLRGFGGSTLRIKSIMIFRGISKICESTYQSVTRRIGDVNITTAYVTPMVMAEKELERLQHVESQTNRKAVRVDDINARHSGTQIKIQEIIRKRRGPKKWDTANGWVITSFKERTRTTISCESDPNTYKWREGYKQEQITTYSASGRGS